jgi:hypothetical protein
MIPGYRLANAEEISAAKEKGIGGCIACAQQKYEGSEWKADHSKINLCKGPGSRRCGSDSFFVKDESR